MKYIKVSIGVRKDICAVYISGEGKLITRRVERIKDEHTLTSNYLTLIYAFNLALRMVRLFSNSQSDDVSVIFEVNNSTFMKWVEKGYTKDAYQKEFIEMMSLLNELPIQYDIIFAQRTMAYSYTYEKYLSEDKMVELDDVPESAEDTEEIVFSPKVESLGKITGLDEFL